MVTADGLLQEEEEEEAGADMTSLISTSNSLSSAKQASTQVNIALQISPHEKSFLVVTESPRSCAPAGKHRELETLETQTAAL